ncbi:hypothetical protein OO013_16120 [Mangrovivirga sp. M17]|uniref:Uncharacterized protein n=1 Tax=Mangrovivirga halotolerans TaxID=2993936 RepID=A0ABT3RUE7_9BACT|nr:hypothetical protein [Mangrovivirga halotolerans]MCX2745406.1 hypothetical protein [Mangrovivirga halotolerans]
MKSFIPIFLLITFFTCNAENVYVNKVRHIKDDLFYIDLNYKDGYDWKAHDEIEIYLGKAREAGSESTIRKVPIDIAKKYFNLPPNEDLWLFDNSSYSKIGLLHFEGVEYYEDMISSYYVAIFKIENYQVPSNSENREYFCISSNSSSGFKKINPEKVDSDLYCEVIKNKYEYNDKMQLSYSSLEHDNSTFTLCSFYDKNYSGNSVLMESIQGKHTILNEILNDEYVIWDFIITPVYYNNKPVLIMEMAVPDTDNYWTQIGIYNGSKYILQSPDKAIVIE